MLFMTLGGIGLLLLGMAMMTEGLKAAAGNALSGLLERSTKTRLRAAFTGFGITAIVQSSSAVIVTTLGFTNAGMLKLRQAAWVVFGSNLGTTMTAWIVAVIGLKLNVQVIALPLIGVGMLLKLFFSKGRAPHIGFALAGFGVLFLGLGILRDAFIDVADYLPLEQLGSTGALGIVLGVLVGALLTALIQSSSAALAIILTASVTGVLTPLLGAALVIGANVGTTATSLLASIGATANARRLALIHVTEKVFTAIIALILLVPLWWVSEWLAGGESGQNISMGLALFHTMFNLLSLVLMWFLADSLIRRVERFIKQPALTSEKPRYLDDTVLSMPAMGVAAMHSELKRVFKQLLGRGRKILNAEAEAAPEPDFHTTALLESIQEFGNKLSAQSSMAEHADVFLNLNWASEESVQLKALLHELATVNQQQLHTATAGALDENFQRLMRSSTLKDMSAEERHAVIADIERARRTRRSELLANVQSGESNAPDVTTQLRIISLLEECAKRIMRISAVIYPAVEKDNIFNESNQAEKN
ncbi:hypothetical protein CWE13_05105 [Aliidiomarina shirensis]|uniref:Na/Pi-cotransporter II-like protein n=1 Tax=Aliidiomarina shirensis TaxID=1048642 RepID=A0A432WUA2_9GAMM|nr:Na/Pi symporter [Aliidiomarina shirensis]RUO37342.1 hypothetical protein CWE13_05105 [Aliidiomarina shirensis]